MPEIKLHTVSQIEVFSTRSLKSISHLCSFGDETRIRGNAESEQITKIYSLYIYPVRAWNLQLNKEINKQTGIEVRLFESIDGRA